MAVDDSYTKALLHMDGSDGSTTFTDESGKTWTVGGNAQIDTAQFKFGGASGLFDGSGDLLSTPSNTDFDFGSGDFTIDFWMRPNSLASSMTILGKRANLSATTPPFLFFHNTTNFYFYFYVNGTLRDLTFAISGNVTTENWYHIAAVRNGNDFDLYLNGVSKDSETWSGAVGTNGDNVRIGGDSNGFNYNGWVDEVRFSKGVARWTANFTPPTSAYAPPSSGGIGFFPFF